MRLKFLLILFIFTFIFYSFNSFSADCKKPTMPSDDEWQQWLSIIKTEALNKGISKKTINQELNGVKPQSKIILRDRCQPESTITLKEYLYYRVDKARIFAGKKILKKYKIDLEEIGKFFSIQPRFIVAVLGMESYYGNPSANTILMGI